MTISLVKNRLVASSPPRVTYVTETADWIINVIGKSLKAASEDQALPTMDITTCAAGVRSPIVHFGSVHTFFKKNGWYKSLPGQRVIISWFHILTHDPRLRLIKEAQRDVSFIHTACQTTKRTLVEAGVDDSKIVIIPLGIGLTVFKPVSKEKKDEMRKSLQIPAGHFMIGSFQKDGVGWGEGNEPKLEKGPDVFVQTVFSLKELNPFVLLTGPARGYVKHALDKEGISYKHVSVRTYPEMAQMYHALDIYLVASRNEGGPMAILESMACGIPLVTTRVGMAIDMVDGQNALTAEIEDAQTLSMHIKHISTDQALAQHLIDNGLKTVEQYDWKKIARVYHEKLYTPCL